ncbi:DUF4184 family protein [Promicromonospora iranensis]|uniref:DUF4184 family protein n=1 Tax=Promicromonospora iranensis TaxID=1105144 RepID=A0ABU2CWJ5_9MICO|nr:DUF4184 family protein [Promicromonospora iranensis]MDR7385690.1 hypothetical protein [Promicromonospora iranensis]
MPFTLAHPAAVLPLLRRPFSAAALVAGAVAPDMPYFARSTPILVTAQSWYEPYLNATTSHGLLGALTVSLPYAIALWGLFLVARRPVVSLLPAPVDPPPPEPGAASARLRRGGWVLLSLLIGITTHLVWDSFTHSDGYVVMHVPFLSTPLAGDLTWSRALQHVSTVGGLVVIAVFLWRRRSRLLPEAAAGRRSAWRLVSIVGGAAAVGAVAGTLGWWSGGSGLSARDLVETVLSDAATGAGAALIAALFLYVTAWWAVRGARAVRQPR